MLLDAAGLLVAGSAVAAPGTVAAPAWLLPTCAMSTVLIPASLFPLLKGMEADKRSWESSAPGQEDGLCTPEQCTALSVSDSPGKGLGLFAIEHIPKGTFLFDYTGEKLSKTEYDVRYPSGVSDYTAGMRTPSGRMDFIDGRDSMLGAPARYMNHDSQTPNVGRRTFCVEEECRILMYALRDLHPGDELQWNYGDGYWAARGEPVL